MSNKTSDDTAKPANDDAAAPPPPSDRAAPETESPASAPSTALDREVAELKDRLLRTLAEMENLRRRTEREVADARTYGIAAFARDMLAVADNMDRALNTSGVEDLGREDGPAKALLEGIALTERGLLDALEKHGIKRIEPLGERFDPNKHQAMYEVPDPSVPAGQVMQVVQSGYLIGERVLRPAMVAVSKGGPKAQPKGQAQSAAQTEEAPPAEASADNDADSSR